MDNVVQRLGGDMTGPYASESLGQIRTLAELIPQLIWVVDDHLQCSYANRRWLETTGQTEEDCLGTGWQASFPDTDRSVLESALAVGDRAGVACRIRQADASEPTYLIQIEPLVSEAISDPGSGRSRYICVATRHERTTVATNQATMPSGSPVEVEPGPNRTSRMIDSESLDHLGLAEIGLDLRFRWLNPRMAQMLGYEIEQVLGRSIFEFTYEVDWPEVQRKLGRRSAGQSETFTRRWRHRDGSEISTLALGSPLRGPCGELVGMLASFIDQTESADQASQLRESEELRRLALESAKLGTFDYDVVANRVDWDHRACELFDVPPEEPLTYESIVWNKIHPEDRDWVDHQVKAALTPEGEGHLEQEYRVVRRDGRVVWIAARGRVIFADRVDHRLAVRMLGTLQDVTDRRNHELLIQDWKDRYEAAVAASDQVLFDWDTRTNQVVYAGPVRQLTGVELDQLQGAWTPLQERIHPEDRDTLQSALDRALTTGESLRTSFRVVMPNGQIRHIQGRGNFVSIGSDHGLRMIGFLADVTDLIEAQERSARREQQFRMAAAAVKIGTYECDFITGHNDWSSELYEIAGIPEQTPLHEGVMPEVVHPSDRTRFAAKIEAASDPQGDGWIEDEHRLVRPDGSIRWVLVRGRTHFAGTDGQRRAVRSSGIVMDITSRRRAEIAARTSQRTARLQLAELQAIYDNAPVGLCVLDTELRWIRINDQLAEINGYSVQEHLGRRVGDLLPNLSDQAREIFEEILRTGEPVLNHQIVGQTPAQPDQQRTWLEHCVPFRDEEGQIIGINVVYQEITAMKQAEARLAEALERAESADRAKSLFVANMSHELRTPLTAILGYVDLIAERPTDRESAWMLQTIRRNGHRLLELLNDLLDLTKIQSGQFQVERSSLVLSELIADVVQLMREQARRKGLSLQVEAPEAIPERIDSDPKRLRQILINLLSNAIKFTRTGGVTLRVELLSQDSVDSESEAGTEAHAGLAFEVIDTGPGIPAGDLATIFDPFQQGDASASREHEGTGLGLTICRSLANYLGGTISVRSTPGIGSRFQVTIDPGPLDQVPRVPFRDASTDPQPIPSTEPTDRPRTSLPAHRRILVVDDRPDIRYLAGRLLQREGLDVEFAEDGRSALEQVTLRQQSTTPEPPFDLILLDMQMPGLDGFQVTRQLRSQGCGIPIVALTASAMNGDRDHCLQAGCNEYLPKPIDRRSLVEILSRLL